MEGSLVHHSDPSWWSALQDTCPHCHRVMSFRLDFQRDKVPSLKTGVLRLYPHPPTILFPSMALPAASQPVPLPINVTFPSWPPATAHCTSL